MYLCIMPISVASTYYYILTSFHDYLNSKNTFNCFVFGVILSFLFDLKRGQERPCVLFVMSK